MVNGSTKELLLVSLIHFKRVSLRIKWCLQNSHYIVDYLSNLKLTTSSQKMAFQWIEWVWKKTKSKINDSILNKTDCKRYFVFVDYFYQPLPLWKERDKNQRKREKRPKDKKRRKDWTSLTTWPYCTGIKEVHDHITPPKDRQEEE